MRNITRSKNFYLILFADACLIVAAYFLAYLLRFEGEIPSGEWMNFKNTVPYFLALKLIIFIAFGLHGGMWRYTSLVDLLNVLKGTLTLSIIIILAILFIYRFEGFPVPSSSLMDF